MNRLLGSGGLRTPKNPHSLDYLKYLHGVLVKNEKVTEHNRSLLVEALRAIAEILIWGDQNDSTVFDFFLEKQMLSYFLRIMKQKCGSYVCVQLLQTLNILFENIRHETSLYFLLSNNHVNSIITHRFDFSNEEIMAYYISFIKTLSFKLNSYTVHFFFNEQTDEFPLYTEAIKFFNHSEGMVRIAVRTLTLNVYRVSDQSMIDFIRNKTAAPYFSNFVWFIGNHIIDVDNFVQSADNDFASRDRLSDLIAEHLDHIHYINDVLGLRIDGLNDVLVTQLLQRLFIPLYLGSLAPELQPNSLHVSKTMALFLLSNVFLIISHKSLMEKLLSMLLFGDHVDMQVAWTPNITSESSTIESSTVETIPTESLLSPSSNDKSINDRPVFNSLMQSLDTQKSDYGAFYALLLLYAISHNEGVPDCLLEAAQIPAISQSGLRDRALIARLVDILGCACDKDGQVRLITVELCCLVLRQLLLATDTTCALIHDEFYARLVAARDCVVMQLAQVIHTDDIFIDIFDDEFEQFERSTLRLEMISADSALLLSPSNTPLSGVEFSKRLPCGPQEHTRRAAQIYFCMRKFMHDLDSIEETQLPISNSKDCVAVGDCLNLNNSDLLSCTVVPKVGPKLQRFLVADSLQLILVEPDVKRLGWGIVRLVGFLQDVEITGDRDDSRALHIVLNTRARPNAEPLLAAKFLFDDHIRCMAAKQRLTKGRQKARQFKLDRICEILQLPKKPASTSSPSSSATSSTSAISLHQSSTASPKSSMAFNAFKESKGRAPGYATTSQHKDGASKQSSANSSDFETMGIQLDDLSTKKDDIVDEEAKEVPPDDPQIVLPSKLKKSAIHHL